MKITQSFKVSRPRSVVWAFFQDVPQVSTCMPGAELTEDKGDGRYLGRIGTRLGPFNASFDGEAQVWPNESSYSGHVEGKGIDKRGGSRSKLVLNYRLIELGGATQVEIDADVQLSGPVAQFGRTGIITETANILIEQLVRNVEARLAATAKALPEIAENSSQDPQPRPEVRAGPPQDEGHVASSPPPSNNISILALARTLIGSFFRRLFSRNTGQR